MSLSRVVNTNTAYPILRKGRSTKLSYHYRILSFGLCFYVGSIQQGPSAWCRTHICWLHAFWW
ncbi:hypothetical protein F441_07125 [Phytophthora nicotianae CJ01A1]|uniref:Uncharacterized protein n=1 Tax=Phytophthora nicotianae CJ01A1 TaxID=1317063 RepID=W2X8H5_PHYNI|nr:hypothetical protein F441_07125 [Phytophthora nicotianae CJ01A1]